MVTPLTGRASARKTHPIDQVAYEELAKRATRACSSLELLRDERALDALVSGKPRKAVGKKLADNLRRTANKALAAKVHREVPLDDPAAVMAPEPEVGPAEHAEILNELTAAAKVIRSSIGLLPKRQRTALLAKLTGVPFEHVEAELQVGERQFNKLIAAARKSLNASPTASAAFQQLAEEFARHPQIATEAIRAVFGQWVQG